MASHLLMTGEEQQWGARTHLSARSVSPPFPLLYRVTIPMGDAACDCNDSMASRLGAIALFTIKNNAEKVLRYIISWIRVLTRSERYFWKILGGWSILRWFRRILLIIENYWSSYNFFLFFFKSVHIKRSVFLFDLIIFLKKKNTYNLSKRMI